MLPTDDRCSVHIPAPRRAAPRRAVSRRRPPELRSPPRAGAWPSPTACTAAGAAGPPTLGACDSRASMARRGPRRGLPPRTPKDLRAAWLLLLLRAEPSYGYVLRRELGERGFDVDPGTLYRTLRELERDGLITSRWME